MTQINQLSSTDSINAGDLIPIFSQTNGDTRAISFNNLANDVIALIPPASTPLPPILPTLISETNLVDNYYVSTDPDYTLAFQRGFAANIKLKGTPGKIYYISNVVLDSKIFDGQGCVIRDSVGANFCFKLTGYYPKLLNVIFQDQGNVAKVTSNNSGFSSGATSISLTNGALAQAGQQILIENTPGTWEQTLVLSAANPFVGLAQATTSAGTVGQAVVTSFGLVNVTDTNSARICEFPSLENLVFENCTVGIVISPSNGTTAEIRSASLHNIKINGCRYSGISIYGSCDGLNLSNVVIFGGVTDTLTYNGAGVAGAFSVGYNVDLYRDLTVIVNGVTKTYGVDYNLLDNKTVTFINFPPLGSTITIYHYHSGVRALVHDMRGAIIGAGVNTSNVICLKSLIGAEFRGCFANNYQSIIADTNQYIGIWIDNSSKLLFSSTYSTFARNCIYITNSSTITFSGLVTSFSTGYNTLIPQIAEINSDLISSCQVNAATWNSLNYIAIPLSNINLKGTYKINAVSNVAVASNTSAYLTQSGQQSTNIPLDIAEANGFVLGIWAELSVAPGAGQVVTFNFFRQSGANGSLLLVATFGIPGVATGGIFAAITPFNLAFGDKLYCQVIYSASAAPSVPRVIVLRL